MNTYEISLYVIDLLHTDIYSNLYIICNLLTLLVFPPNTEDAEEVRKS